MKKKHLFWHLFPLYWALTVLSILAVSFYAFHFISNLFLHTPDGCAPTPEILQVELPSKN